MAAFCQLRRLFGAGLLLGLLAWTATPVRAQTEPPNPQPGETLRLWRNIPGDSKPIVLDADVIATWLEGRQRVVLLMGRVMIEQGLVHARMDQAVVWIDLDHFQKQRVLRAEVFAEGNVRLENGSESRAGPAAYLDLNTRGEFRLNSHQQKISQQAQTSHPLVSRSRADRAAAAAEAQKPTQPVQRTSYYPPPEVPGTPVQDPGGVPPLTIPPIQVPSPTAPPPPSAGVPSPNPPEAPFPPSMPPVTAPPPPSPAAPAPAPPVRTPPGPTRQFSVMPRTGNGFESQVITLANGEEALVVSGGVILTIRNVERVGLVDIEADRLVVWLKGNAQQVFENLRSPQGQSGREYEFYLAGNVELRQQTNGEGRVLRADEVYYDVSRNVAVAVRADLEFTQPGLPDRVHFKADEMEQLNADQFRAANVEVFSSRLPSDPGLKLYIQDATLDVKRTTRRSVFGVPFIDRTTGQPQQTTERLVRGRNVFLKAEDVPFFYLPYIQADATDPLGPLESVSFNGNRIFGFQFLTTWNVYDLLAMDPLPGSRWKLFLDLLTRRGPAVGSNFDYSGTDLFGIPSRYTGLVKSYGMYDGASDILGGSRGDFTTHPDLRGRLLWRQNVADLPFGFTVQSQLGLYSDHNFHEQYFKSEFDQDVNQDTFLYAKQQYDTLAWTGLAQVRLREWFTTTMWLPEVEGYALGESFFDLFTYNARAGAGYGLLRPAEGTTPPTSVTDQRVDTGRFDLMQDLSVPFALGALKLVPYGVLDLTYYTEDLTGDSRGRFYGAGGLRASIPLSRLYPEVQSELFNLDGLYHKAVLSANYYIAHSDTPFSQLPQLSRLNDDATDQAIRDIRPTQPFINPGAGVALATSPLYDPQTYAIRRLIDNRVDTLDTVEVLQTDLRQRWQTKRGYPGQEHVIDWMTLDLSGSFFPHGSRDNFGSQFAFLEYDWLWNVGDRTSLLSQGWVDPIDNGAQVFNIGAQFNRTDRTNFYLGYRQISPVGSKMAIGAVTYICSPKYAITAGVAYDFGTSESLSNSLVITRMGKDVQLSLGLTYNGLVDTFGITFEIIPNLVALNRRPATPGGLVGR